MSILTIDSNTDEVVREHVETVHSLIKDRTVLSTQAEANKDKLGDAVTALEKREQTSSQLWMKWHRK